MLAHLSVRIMLAVTTWLWGNKYSADDVEKLSSSVHRHLNEAHVFILFSDQPMKINGVEVVLISDEDMHLTMVPGCFVRLRMFDPAFQVDVIRGRRIDRFVNLDLDTVITNELDPVFNRPEPFVILHGANSTNPCPYCGAMMLIRPGAHPELWRDFDITQIKSIPHFSFPDDQAWIAYKVPNAAGWQAGKGGVYAFCKPGWPPGHNLPPDARIVNFNGWRSPAQFKTLEWVNRNWKK